MAYINKDNPVYISYAWGEDLEIDVNKLCVLMENNGIFFKRDKAKGENSLCPYRYNIIDAEEEIGRGKAIIVVISDKYIKSLNCMYEWHCICKTGNITKRVFPIVLPGTKLKQEFRYNSFKKFFEGRLQDISDREVMSNIEPKERKCLENDGYIKDLETLRNYITEYNIPDLESLREYDYQIIIEQLKEHVTKVENEERKETPTQISTFAPHFPFSVPDGLMSRDTEEENLFNLISKNRIVNLVGVGGSGKSSLAYLCLNRHKDDFNEIAFVVVNNNVKNDMVDQLNRTLKLEFEEDEYTEIITFLQENYKSEKPNLLVLDINETADKDKTVEYINEILKNTAYLAGWKILILSRESVDTRNRIKTHNLNDKEDFDFLKQLFLEKAGARYNDFGDFAGLFKVIYYNPLLAEQLGWYLNGYPKTVTLDGIKKILYGSLGEQEMQGMSAAQRHDENVNTFLKNLIVYDNLEENEQKLLRHFVLWQSEYIEYDVIADLLKDVFESEDELINTLTSLSKRSILTTNNEDTLSYKLHGLLADSLREQIDIDNEDYDEYLWNIDRIIEYGYYKFVPFVDSITNSLCEYDIAANNSYLGYSLVNNVGRKLSISWKRDHAIRLLSKNIRDIEEHIKRDKDNNSLYDKLIIAHSYIPSDQSILSKTNLEKAIEILEKMPKDAEKYQHALALVYSQYASEQSKFEDVVSIFDKIFEIRHNLPKTNEYKNSLADDYDTLAFFSEVKFYKYIFAKANYEKAIAIREQLPKDNPEYQNDLASTYNNLGDLQQDHLAEYELSKSNYEKAIAIQEQLPKDNPEYQYVLARSYYNLANLQDDHLGDYDSAKSNFEKAIEILELLPKDNPKYQNDLAGSYNGLAYTYDKLSNYDKAIDSINTAIDITSKLKETDSKCLIYWLNRRHSLAEIKYNNGKDLDEVKNTLLEIQPIAQQCLKDNPNDKWTKDLNDEISALLSKIE